MANVRLLNSGSIPLTINCDPGINMVGTLEWEERTIVENNTERNDISRVYAWLHFSRDGNGKAGADETVPKEKFRITVTGSDMTFTSPSSNPEIYSGTFYIGPGDWNSAHTKFRARQVQIFKTGTNDTTLNGGITYFSDSDFYFDVAHTGAKVISFSVTGATDTVNLTSCSGSGSITLTAFTSACTAPTSVSASGIIKPSDSFTVSWSGAAGGINNSITGQEIQWRITGAGSAPTISTQTGMTSVVSSATSGSATISITNATRAQKIVCGVRVKGSAGSAQYSSLKTGGSVTINSLPTAPTVSVNKTVVPSSGGSVTFTLTPGSDVDTSQTKTLQYTIGSSTNEISCSTSLTVNVTTTTTQHFYTYDGLEPSSSSTDQTITVNIKPTINSITVATPTKQTALNTNGTTGSRQGWVNDFKPTGITQTTNQTSTLTVCVFMKTATQTTTTANSITNSSMSYSYTQPTVTNISAASSGSKTLDTTYSVDAAVTNQCLAQLANRQVIWRVGFKLNDGYEDSAWKFWPTTDGQYYAIAPVPSVSTINKYNQDSDSNISGSIAGHFSRHIRLTFQNDDSVTNRAISATVNNVSLTLANTSWSTSGNILIVDFNITSSVASGATVNIQISLSNANIIKTFSTTMIKCLSPTISNFQYPNTIKPFTVRTINSSIAWPYGSSVDLPTANANYEIKSQELIQASSSSGANSKTITLTSSVNKNGDNLIWSNTSYDFNTGTLGFTASDYYGEKTYYVKFVIKNVYDDIFDTGFIAKVFNFNELIVLQDVTWQFSNNGSNYYSVNYNNNNTVKIQENMQLRAIVNYKQYTTESITFSILRDGTKISNITASVTSQKAQGNTTITIDYRVPQMSVSRDRIQSIQAIGNQSGAASGNLEKTLGTIKHVAPQVQLVSCNYITGTTNQFAPVCNFNNIGASDNTITSVTYQIYNTSDLPLTNATTKTDNLFIAPTMNYTGSATFEQLSIKVRITTTIQTTYLINNNPINIISTKTIDTNIFIIYTDQPTVAYRKNRIGINTSSPNVNTVLDIHLTSTTKCIRLYGDTDKLIYIQPLSGEIGFAAAAPSGSTDPTYEHVINILKGTLN